MSNSNNKTKSKKNQYKHLTIDDRAKIQTLIEQLDDNGKRIYSNTYIANYLGVHKSTITRELRRIKSKVHLKTGTITNKPYNVRDAQDDADFKRGLSKAEYIVEQFPKLKKYIEDKILIKLQIFRLQINIGLRTQLGSRNNGRFARYLFKNSGCIEYFTDFKH